MSSPALATFLEKLHRELLSYKEYRKELDRRPQTFVFHKRTLLAETLKQLTKGHKMDLTETDNTAIKSIVDKAAKDLVKQLNFIAGGKLKSPGGKTTLVFFDETNVPIPKYYNVSLPYTAFSRVKFSYRNVLNDMFTELQQYLRDHATLDTIKTKNGSDKKSIIYFFDAGHDEKAGVFERFLDEKTADIMTGLNSSIEGDSEAERRKLLAQLKQETGIDDLDTIVIKIESTNTNRSRGQKVGQRSRKIRAKLRAFMDGEGKVTLAELAGSDSLKTQKIKKAHKRVLDPLRRVKNATVKTKLKPIKKSTKKPVKKPIKLNPKNAAAMKLGVMASARKTRSRKAKQDTPASSPLAMIAMINKELPKTVRDNMNEPRLVNRTGRFAASVRVTDIVQTPKGFPSIGYTYRRDPYQVFEEGSTGAWSNGQRDPRQLIDTSIREIATKMAIGRFYTRRV